MNESILEEIVAESYRREYEQFENAPEHDFSIKHKLAMKRIFARCSKNTNKSEYKKRLEINGNTRRLSLKQRLLVAAIVIILMTLLAGWVAVYISRDFHGTVHRDYTQLNVVNTDKCPQAIEHKYVLSEIPAGFAVVETTSSPVIEHSVYYNSVANKTFGIAQWVKTSYHPNYNTEHNNIEEIDIGGHTALCMDFSDDKHSSSQLVWDNGDYIIEICGDLPKNTLINLAKSIKILQI